MLAENQRRNRMQAEFKLRNTGVFDDGRYFGVVTAYTKMATDDILRSGVANRIVFERVFHKLLHIVADSI